MIILDYLEEVLNFYGQGDYEKEITSAKEEFEDKFGKIHDESPFYESFLNVFHDWYIFNRTLSAKGLTPIKKFITEGNHNLSIEQVDLLRVFATCSLGVYEVLKVKNDQVFLKNLLHKEKKVLTDAVFSTSLQRGDVAQFRLLPYKEQNVASMFFILHPKNAKRIIAKSLKNKLEYNILMNNLIRYRVKNENYNHLDPSKVYSEEGVV